MSIRTIVTRGYGNGTFTGTIAEVVLRGYVSLVSPDSTFGVIGIIQERGQGVTGLISAIGQGVTGTISPTFGVFGIIQERGLSVTGTINNTGQGVDGEI